MDREVDELVRLQAKSKASQSSIGEVNNAYADAGKSIACPVALYNRLRRLKPEHFAEENWRSFFFTCSDGKVLLKTAVERLLKAAAKRLGFDSDAFTSHSLRAGGATAHWHAGYDSLMIQRRGALGVGVLEAVYLGRPGEGAGCNHAHDGQPAVPVRGQPKPRERLRAHDVRDAQTMRPSSEGSGLVVRWIS